MHHPKSVLITGASSGIGHALALEYASAGVVLLLLGRDEARLAQVAAECRARGAVVETASVDVRDKEKMADVILRFDDAHPLALVIANAGISAGTFGGEKNFDAAQGVFDVNLGGVLHTIHPILPRMTKRKAGQLAIISSLAGIMPWPGAAAYSASKAAVRYYGEALHAQLRRYNVSVSVVCPGWIHTPLVAVNKFPMPMIMHADKAAKIIRRGISQRKMRIVFPKTIYFALRFAQMLPVAFSNYLSSLAPSK